MQVALTIAGSDSGGGAGIQADLKAFKTLGFWGTTCITAVTAQNTAGVTGVHVLPPEMVRAQLEAVWNDLRPVAVKTGMLADAATVQVVASFLAPVAPASLVVDPVMVSTSGHRLLAPEAVTALTKELLPLARAVTPNLAELEILAGGRIRSPADWQEAAASLRKTGVGFVLAKGGHFGASGTALDFLYDCRRGRFYWLTGPRFPGTAHGTGCVLSAALVCYLARGLSPPDAAWRAKALVARAISRALRLGKGYPVLDPGGVWRGLAPGL
ncbi:MAG: bifunctional hydroxymethylpyrimidine kinase/phosphomethylpyrimidine kinase [Clostridia bacterium]|nr:MAG: bifunctional hydroxymethylpyrimidine kinase/phosphomethylpyrimidine kinase [Clostridia bacterium]